MDTERPRPRLEDERSKSTKAQLGATALEIREFLMQNESEVKEAVKEAEDYHNLVDRKINHVVEPYTPEYFVDWQVECLEQIKDEKNVILSSPTGSGKTAVFMEWAKLKQEEGNREKPGHQVYITAPIKALSNQRFRELAEQGFKVGLETGDIKNVPEDADFICCTQEIYTNKYVEKENATLIVDEFHYIFENGERSRSYIDGIHDSKAKNILLCSATFGDMDKLSSYVDKVTSRKFKPYENHERLTTLDYGGYIPIKDIKDALVVTFSARNCEAIADRISGCWNEADDETISAIKEICEKYHTRYDSRMAKGIATYYGRKLPKEKLCIEELFEKRLIDTVVGTDALSLGVNFPVDKVVFAQLAKYKDGPISKNLFDQLSGRAGRKGYFDHGTVYYCDDFYGYNGYPIESQYYSTDELFDELLDAKPEDVSISLSPNIKNILTNQSSIDEEASYLSQFSTENISFEESRDRIEWVISAIQNFKVAPFMHLDEEAEEYLHDLKRNWASPEEINQFYETYAPGAQEEFNKNISNTYTDLLSWEENCKLLASLILCKTGEEIWPTVWGWEQDYDGGYYLNGYYYSEDSDWSNIYSSQADLQQLLIERQVIRSLPRKYRKKFNIAALEKAINDLDETVLNQGRGMLSVNDIEKSLTKEEE